MDEIKALIEKYDLYQVGDKIGCRKTSEFSREEFVREVGPRKAEVIAHFEAQKAKAEEARKKMEETFSAIPGVRELRSARRLRAKWEQELNRMIEAGDGQLPKFEAPTPQQLAEMEALYPMAVFALEAESCALYSSNSELRKIWKETYAALCEGQEPTQVKAKHAAKMDEFVKSHIWD